MRKGGAQPQRQEPPPLPPGPCAPLRNASPQRKRRCARLHRRRELDLPPAPGAPGLEAAGASGHVGYTDLEGLAEMLAVCFEDQDLSNESNLLDIRKTNL